MVKGVTRRVVVVKQPEGRLFEEAIFIVREDILSGGSVSRRDIVSEASRVAEDYFHSGAKKRRFRLPAPVFAGLGAAATGIFWLLSTFLL